MPHTTDHIAELFRAVNELGKLAADEKRWLLDRGVCMIQELRLEAGIRTSRTSAD